MADLVREVVAQVDKLADEAVELCRSLVRINTVNPYAGAGTTGLEIEGQRHLEPILQGLGGKTRLFEPPPDIYERMGVIGPKGRSWADRPNLVTEFDLGARPDGSAGKRVIFNSHMDTVGVEGMAFDPFCAEIRDGKILGRGASDDKSGMAAGVIAIKAALRFADELAGTILHESVVDEECNGSGAGTLACCLEGYKADEAIVIDGYGLIVTRGCQGCLTAGVTVRGKAGHAATGGVNAIDKAVHVKSAIDCFQQARQADRPGCLVNLGVFRGGVHPAVVPDSAEMALNIVYAIDEARANEQRGAGWNGSAVRSEFERVIAEADAADDWLRDHPSQVAWVKDLVPFETAEDADVTQNMVRAYEAALGASPTIDIMSAWADGANMSRYGGVPTIQFGTGTESAAHAQDEVVEIDEMINGAKILAVYLVQQLAEKT